MSATKIVKSIILTASAQEHHNSVKIKNILKWLKSGYEVRILINGKSDRRKAMDNIFRQLEQDVKNGAQVNQKVVKPESIRFNLRPTPEACNLVIDNNKEGQVDFSFEDISTDQDLDDIERKLEESIKKDKSKSKK